MINTINNKKLQKANEDYEYLHNAIIQHGVEFDNTKALFNVGFYITNPLANAITNKERNWKLDYAQAEWQWYLSGNRNISELGKLYGKTPEIWKRMADSKGNVNSNYGWQWLRNNQIYYVINKLKEKNNTRHAAISIYDCKEHSTYKKDTPCTYAVQFTILHDKLDMCVVMRSNDLWYGFCNDQYCFSELQKMIAHEVGVEVGVYYHFAHNMHLYNDKV